MKAFKYLVFLFSFILSSSAFSAQVEKWIIHGTNGTFSKAQVWSKCLSLASAYGTTCFDDGIQIRINKGPSGGGISGYGMFSHYEEELNRTGFVGESIF